MAEDDTLPPVLMPYDPTGTIPLGVLTVSKPGAKEQDVKDLARVDVRNRLGGVKGCVAPVVVGGIIPPDDEVELLRRGVARVYSPKDFSLAAIMDDMLALLEA